MGFWGSFFGKIRKALLPACRAIKTAFTCCINGVTSAFTYCIDALRGTITYCIDSVITGGKWVIKYAKENPISAALIILGVVIIVVPLIVGFGPAGPMAGTAAAMWQASIGNVVSGTLFAILQSLTMTGVFTTIGAVFIGVGIVLPFLKRWFGK